MKLRRDLYSLSQRRDQTASDDKTPARPCVMYVGPSQHSVNVVLGECMEYVYSIAYLEVPMYYVVHFIFSVFTNLSKVSHCPAHVPTLR